MKPKIIGIVGGAGPLAGVKLFEKVIEMCNRKYGCYKDEDYPQIILNSFPFSDMLSEENDYDLLREELSLALNQLRYQGSEVLAIACNTLHIFLENECKELINLPQLLGDEMKFEKEPLVLCTSTSRLNSLHAKYFVCSYLENSSQLWLDNIIMRILQGAEPATIVEDLFKIIEQEEASCIVLGCTELSIYARILEFSGKKIIDPLDFLAKKLLEKSFGF